MAKTDAASIRTGSRDRTPLALAGVVAAYAVLNSIASIASWVWPKMDDGIPGIIAVGVLVFQPMMFGVWTALGPGSILTRLPMAVPCLMLLFVAPGYVPPTFANTRRKEFVVAALVGFAIYAATLIVFLVFRWFTGFRIQPHASQSTTENVGIKFSIKYLFALITVCAVALGLTTQLRFQTAPPPWSILGPDFFIAIMVFGGAFLSAAVLPTLAVPLAILHGRPSAPAVKSAIAFWVVVTLSTVVILMILNDKDGLFEFIGAALLAQLAAILAGSLTALFLRRAGLQLMCGRSAATPKPSPPIPSP